MNALPIASMWLRDRAGRLGRCAAPLSLLMIGSACHSPELAQPPAEEPASANREIAPGRRRTAPLRGREPRSDTATAEKPSGAKPVDGRALINDLIRFVTKLPLDPNASIEDLDRWRAEHAATLDALSIDDRTTIERLLVKGRQDLLLGATLRGEIDREPLLRASLVGQEACRRLVALHTLPQRSREEESMYQELLSRREQDLILAFGSIEARLRSAEDPVQVDQTIDSILAMPGDMQLAVAADIRAAGEREKVRIERWRERPERKSPSPTPSKQPRMPVLRELPPPPELPRVRGPFDRLAGGDLLNAIYSRNTEAIATFNEHYRLRRLRQFRSLVGDHPLARLMEAGIGQIRIEENVLAVFLLHYEDAFGACLGEDAVEFVLTEHEPDTVLENGFGMEVARFHGGTSRTTYRVKPEFAPAFRRIGKMKPEGAAAGLSDLILNAGETDLRGDAVKGTRQILGQFRCDSEEVRRFEQALLEIYQKGDR